MIELMMLLATGMPIGQLLEEMSSSCDKCKEELTINGEISEKSKQKLNFNVTLLALHLNNDGDMETAMKNIKKMEGVSNIAKLMNSDLTGN